MHPIATAVPFDVRQDTLISAGRIVLRLTTALQGPQSESKCFLERFDGPDLDHVLTVVYPERPLESAYLEAIDLLVTELKRALDELSPF